MRGGSGLPDRDSGRQLSASLVIVATNAYTGSLTETLRRSVVAVPSFQVATAPLAEALRAGILPEGQAASDTCRLLRYFRLDSSGRLVMGARGSYTATPTTFTARHHYRAVREIYPQLEGIGFDYHWGGFVALTAGPPAAPARARAGDVRRSWLQRPRGGHGNGDGTAPGALGAGQVTHEAGLPRDAGASDTPARPQSRRRAGHHPVLAPRGRLDALRLSVQDGAQHEYHQTVLLIVLVLINVVFVIGWVWSARRHRLTGRPTIGDAVIGVFTDFLDTLGIGSFAPTTALFKFRGRPADELIPGTLNVGHNSSAFLETMLFVTAVTVDPMLLACMIASAAAGAWLGAGVVSRLPRRTIQLCMGIALLVAAAFFVMKNLGAFPPGGWHLR